MKRCAFAQKTLFAAALAASLAGCVGGEDGDDLADVTDDLIGGFPARSPKLNAVGALARDYWIGIDADGNSIYQRAAYCTGTLIAPTVVLTAEHCNPTAGDFFQIGPDVASPVRTVPITAAAHESTIVGGGLGNGSDVAIAHLGESVDNVPLFAFAALPPGSESRRFSAIGFGVQDNFETSGTRRSGSVTFQHTGGEVRGFPLLDIYEGLFGNGLGDAQICFGDSGGPVTGQLNGKTTAFGVASWVIRSEEQICNYASTYSMLGPVALDFVEREVACPLMPLEGACADFDTVVRCSEPGEGPRRPLSQDCDELGQICGEDETGELACIDDPCEGLTTEGSCDGDVASRCSRPEEGPRRPLSTDCSEILMTCGTDPVTGEAGCVDPLE